MYTKTHTKHTYALLVSVLWLSLGFVDLLRCSGLTASQSSAESTAGNGKPPAVFSAFESTQRLWDVSTKQRQPTYSSHYSNIHILFLHKHISNVISWIFLSDFGRGFSSVLVCRVFASVFWVEMFYPLCPLV